MLTPIEIQQMEFSKSFSGFSKKEVVEFLNTISKDYEGVVTQNGKYREDINELTKSLEIYRDKESQINKTLVRVESFSESTKELAKKESDLIIKEAQLKADDVISTSREKAAVIESEIDFLKKEKDRFLQDIRFLTDRFSGMVDSESESNTVCRENLKNL